MSLNGNILIKLLCVALFLVSGSGFANQPVELRSLNSNQTIQWARDNAKGSELFVYFQADCLSCRQQAKQLGCLSDQVVVRFVGAKSKAKGLRKAALRMGVLNRAFIVDEAGLRTYGFNEPVTPQMAFYGTNTKSHWIGYKSCEEIKNIVEPEGADEPS